MARLGIVLAPGRVTGVADEMHRGVSGTAHGGVTGVAHAEVQAVLTRRLR
ncbi:hypothetical protein [Mycolicibacterium tokaiense]|nr:hypothetical protein [Mycolicibacterium tokaiense]